MSDFITKEIPVTIDVSEDDNLSTEARVGINQKLVGLYIPASMTSTSITFQVSTDNDTYYTVRTYTGDLTATIDSNAARLSLDPLDFLGATYIKVATGSNEGADRALTFIATGI